MPASPASEAALAGALDRERFDDLRGLYEPVEFVDLVQTFLRATHETVGTAHDAWEREDVAELRAAAHRLRGGCLALGAMGMADAAGAVEAGCGGPEPTRARLAPSVDDLLAQWRAARVVLAAAIT